MARRAKTEQLIRETAPATCAWLIARYRPVSLFSLRMTHATSKGGKTLVVPTPYAVKMALIDACFRRFDRSEALNRAREVFDWIKRCQVRFRPPKHCIVQNTFAKMLDHWREGDLPFRQTIVYREFAYFGESGEEGDLLVAISASALAPGQRGVIQDLFAHINSFGKRGSFFQFTEGALLEGELPVGYTIPVGERLPNAAGYAMIQVLDDFGEALCAARDGFERISTYGAGTVKLNEHRILTPTAIPYMRRSAARNFTWYQRLD